MHDALLRIRDTATLGLVPDRNARRVLAVAAFALATAFGAHVVVPIGPVPMTLQPLFVLLAGALLGPALGAASQLVYLGMGAVGLPVFAAGGGLAYLVGPTGGYLLAFPVTAFLAGVAATRAPRNALGLPLLFVGLLLASFVTLLGGTAWLATLTGDPTTAFAVGMAPFLAGDLVKAGLATLIAWRARRRTHGLL